MSPGHGILDEAIRVASRVGLNGLTIGSLAARTQLSKSGLFARFGSKEDLQLRVLEHANAYFRDTVTRPMLAAPRGEPRMRALFERWLAWERDALPGGCLFLAAAAELDDQPGPVRDMLAASQLDWSRTIMRVFDTGVAEGHLRADADRSQFVFSLRGIMHAFQFTSRLLGDPASETYARRAFEALLNSVHARGVRPNRTPGRSDKEIS